LFELLGNGADHGPRRLSAVVPDDPVGSDEGRHQRHVRLDDFEQLRFEEQLPETEALGANDEGVRRSFWALQAEQQTHERQDGLGSLALDVVHVLGVAAKSRNADGAVAVEAAGGVTDQARLARLEQGERASQQREDIVEDVRTDAADPFVDEREQCPVVNEQEPAATQEPFDPGRALGGVFAPRKRGGQPASGVVRGISPASNTSRAARPPARQFLVTCRRLTYGLMGGTR
jgi:hypothetical protein